MFNVNVRLYTPEEEAAEAEAAFKLEKQQAEDEAAAAGPAPPPYIPPSIEELIASLPEELALRVPSVPGAPNVLKVFPPIRAKTAMHMVDRRGYKLLSPLCRPDGITMQSAYEICTAKLDDPLRPELSNFTRVEEAWAGAFDMGVDSHMLSRSISQSSMGVSCYAPYVLPSHQTGNGGGAAIKTKIDSATIKCGSPYPGARGEKIVYTLYTSSSTGMSPEEMNDVVEARSSYLEDLTYMTKLCNMDCVAEANKKNLSTAWKHNCGEDQLECATKGPAFISTKLAKTEETIKSFKTSVKNGIGTFLGNWGYSKAVMELRMNGKSSTEAGTRDGDARNLVESDFDVVGYHAELTLSIIEGHKPEMSPIPYLWKQFVVRSFIVAFEGPPHDAPPSLTSVTAQIDFQLDLGTRHCVPVNDCSGERLIVKGTAWKVPHPFTGAPIAAYCKLYTVGKIATRGGASTADKETLRGSGTIVWYPEAKQGEKLAVIRTVGTINHNYSSSFIIDVSRSSYRWNHFEWSGKEAHYLEATTTYANPSKNESNGFFNTSKFFNHSGDSASGVWKSTAPPALELNSNYERIPGAGGMFRFVPMNPKRSWEPAPLDLTFLTEQPHVAGRCQKIQGILASQQGFLYMGRPGGMGPMPTKLTAPAWGTIGCNPDLHGDSFSFIAAIPSWRPYPDDRNVKLENVVISATLAPAKDLQRMNRGGNASKNPYEENNYEDDDEEFNYDDYEDEEVPGLNSTNSTNNTEEMRVPTFDERIKVGPPV